MKMVLMVKKKKSEREMCPRIMECERKVPYDVFLSICMRDWKLCREFDKKPREWLKEYEKERREGSDPSF